MQLLRATPTLLVFVSLAVSSRGSSSTEQDALAALIARIPVVARGDPGIGPAEQRLASEILAHGAAAIPWVLPLLESDQSNVRSFAGFVAGDLKGLSSDHLRALIGARRRGDGWVPRAIGRIGTPEAITFLLTDLEADPTPWTQVEVGLVFGGKLSARMIGETFRRSQPLKPRYAAALCHVLHDLRENSVPAVEPMVAAAKARALPIENRILAAQTVGCVGESARWAIPVLNELAAQDPKSFADATAASIRTMGTPEAVPGFVAALRAHPSVPALQDIARLRENGRESGAAVAELLSSQDWDIRVAAARTLGFIGYRGSTQSLVDALKDENDWRLVYVAAESLGRIGDATAIPALEKTAREHWFSRVRDAARKAIEVIRKRDSYVSRWHPDDFRDEFHEYELLFSGERPDPPTDLWLSSGFDEFMKAGQPHLRVDDGVLEGTDNGEWGGNLTFESNDGNREVLLTKNVHGIHRTDYGIVAVTGLAHMGSNFGDLYRVEPLGHGTFSVVRWKVLPGAPRESGFRWNGELVVTCESGYVVALTPEGQLRVVE
jgi:HEAT repeat protein